MYVMKEPNVDNYMIIIFIYRHANCTDFGYKYVNYTELQGVINGNAYGDWDISGACNGSLLATYASATGTDTIDNVLQLACFAKLKELNAQLWGDWTIEEV